MSAAGSPRFEKPVDHGEAYRSQCEEVNPPASFGKEGLLQLHAQHAGNLAHPDGIHNRSSAVWDRRLNVVSRIPLADARGSPTLILSRDREGAVVKYNARQPTRV